MTWRLKGTSKNLERMAHGFILLPNEARRREDTGTKYPTKEQLLHPDLAGDVRREKGAVPNGSAQSEDAAGGRFFVVPS